MRFYGESLEIKELVDMALELSSTLETLKKDDDKVLLELAKSYARLFLGAGQKIVPLWESVYLSPKGILYQEPFFNVLEEYSRFGFKKREDYKEPEDHLSVELYFMKKLTEKQCEVMEESLLNDLIISQLNFLEKHLLRWIPRFVEELEEQDSLGFYKLMSKALYDFLRVEKDFLNKSIFFSKEININ